MGISVRTIFFYLLLEIFFLFLNKWSARNLLWSCLASSLLTADVASTLNNIYGADINNQLSFSIKEIFIALLMPIIGTILISTGFLFKIYLSERNTNYKHISSTNFLLFKKIYSNLSAYYTVSDNSHNINKSDGTCLLSFMS